MPTQPTSTPPVEPLTWKEIDDFLVQMDKRQCPWCNGQHWGLHIDSTLMKENGNKVIPGLRSLSRIRIEPGERGNDLKASISAGTESALVAIVAECTECGHLYFFNYFTVLTKARAKRTQENGNDPSI